MSEKQVITSKDVETLNSLTGELVKVKGWATVIPLMDPGEVSDRFTEAILQADSLEAMLTPPEDNEGLGEYIGREIIIHDVRAGLSSFKEGPGIFCLVDVETKKTGQHSIATTGASNVVAQLAKAFAAGWLPFSCRVVEVQSKTNPERKIQWLVSADAF
jgi:hypothetical protein